MILAASFSVSNPELWVNRGLSYGDGLFETMCLIQNRIPLLDFHLKRLAKDLKKLQLNDFDPKNIEQALIDISAANEKAILKLMVFRSNQVRTYRPLTRNIDWVLTLEKMPEVQTKKPLKLMLSKQKISAQPILAGMKHLSRLEQVMLSNELNEHSGFDDLLIMDRENRIIETTYQNIVMIKDGCLYSPKLDQSGVKGVALTWLHANYEVHARHINIKDINEYEGMMICNSIRGFGLVASLDQVGKFIWHKARYSR